MKRCRHTQVFSVFVQDQISLIEDKLSLTIGSKFEHNDFTGFEFQPTGRLLWTPTNRQSVWLAVSRAVRTPTLLENDIDVGGLGGPVFPRVQHNRDLESEALLAYEIGYRIQATEKLSFDTALFYNEYDNLFVALPGPVFTNATGTPIRPLNRDNRMTAETYGVELAATWRLMEGWRLYGTYTLLKMNLHRDSGRPPIPSP